MVAPYDNAYKVNDNYAANYDLLGSYAAQLYTLGNNLSSDPTSTLWIELTPYPVPCHITLNKTTNCHEVFASYQCKLIVATPVTSSIIMTRSSSQFLHWRDSMTKHVIGFGFMDEQDLTDFVSLAEKIRFESAPKPVDVLSAESISPVEISNELSPVACSTARATIPLVSSALMTSKFLPPGISGDNQQQLIDNLQAKLKLLQRENDTLRDIVIPDTKPVNVDEDMLISREKLQKAEEIKAVTDQKFLVLSEAFCRLKKVLSDAVEIVDSVHRLIQQRDSD